MHIKITGNRSDLSAMVCTVAITARKRCRNADGDHRRKRQRKIRIAEKQAAAGKGGPLYYLATHECLMGKRADEGEPPAAAEREKALQQNARPGWIWRNRGRCDSPSECMTNLAANEMFSGEGPKMRRRKRTGAGRDGNRDRQPDTGGCGASVCQVPESGNRYRGSGPDGISYDESTESYIRLLQRLTAACVKRRKKPMVVYTIPICLKKKPEEPAVGKESL